MTTESINFNLPRYGGDSTYGVDLNPLQLSTVGIIEASTAVNDAVFRTHAALALVSQLRRSNLHRHEERSAMDDIYQQMSGGMAKLDEVFQQQEALIGKALELLDPEDPWGPPLESPFERQVKENHAKYCQEAVDLTREMLEKWGEDSPLKKGDLTRNEERITYKRLVEIPMELAQLPEFAREASKAYLEDKHNGIDFEEDEWVDNYLFNEEEEREREIAAKSAEEALKREEAN
jgi:hypothetical protein